MAKRYYCNPAKKKLCNKRGCFINGGGCYMTLTRKHKRNRFIGWILWKYYKRKWSKKKNNKDALIYLCGHNKCGLICKSETWQNIDAKNAEKIARDNKFDCIQDGKYGECKERQAYEQLTEEVEK